MGRVPNGFVALLCFLAVFVPTTFAEQLPVSSYTSADGLGSSFVNALMRDSRGFLWVCTRDGLSRFDGSRFVTYQVGDKNAAPGIEQHHQRLGAILGHVHPRHPAHSPGYAATDARAARSRSTCPA